MNTITLPAIKRPNFINGLIDFGVAMCILIAAFTISHYVFLYMTADFPLHTELEPYEMDVDEIGAIVMLLKAFSFLGALLVVGSLLFFMEFACHGLFGKLIFNFKRRVGTESSVLLNEHHIEFAKSIFDKNGVSFDRQAFSKRVSTLNDSGDLYFGYYTFGPVYFHVIGGDVSSTGRRNLIVSER